MSSVLRASAQGATFLILLQIGSRALTFIINQVLLRYLSPEILGVATQLELYSISVLYFSRDSLRVALQRQPDNIQKVVNLASLAFVLGTPLSLLLRFIWTRTGLPQVPYIADSLWLYGLASVLELLAEPGFIVSQQKLLYKVRAAAETFATIMRCIVTCGTAIWASHASCKVGVLPFALGQMAYACALFGVYLGGTYPVMKQEGFSLLPSPLPEAAAKDSILSLFSQPLLQLTSSIFLQSTLKYVLTQGDAILITSLASLADQGAYALASNYGGLIARMLFQPIEESSRNLFAKLCAPPPSSPKPAADTPEPPKSSKSKDRAKSKETSTSKDFLTSKDPTTTANLQQAMNFLTTILHLYLLISLLAVTLGPTASSPLLHLIAGSRWSTTGASDVLASYCYYIPLLALNGVTEAFVAAVATNTELHVQSLLMGAFFFVFAASTYFFLSVLRLGAKGLVYANCVNMGLRIVFNVSFIKKFFSRRGVRFALGGTLPSAISVAAAVAMTGMLKQTEDVVVFPGPLGELVRIGGVAGAFGLAMAVGERAYIMQCYRMLRPHATTEEKDQ